MTDDNELTNLLGDGPTIGPVAPVKLADSKLDGGQIFEKMLQDPKNLKKILKLFKNISGKERNNLISRLGNKNPFTDEWLQQMELSTKSKSTTRDRLKQTLEDKKHGRKAQPSKSQSEESETKLMSLLEKVVNTDMTKDINDIPPLINDNGDIIKTNEKKKNKRKKYKLKQKQKKQAITQN